MPWCQLSGCRNTDGSFKVNSKDPVAVWKNISNDTEIQLYCRQLTNDHEINPHELETRLYLNEKQDITVTLFPLMNTPIDFSISVDTPENRDNALNKRTQEMVRDNVNRVNKWLGIPNLN